MYLNRTPVNDQNANLKQLVLACVALNSQGLKKHASNTVFKTFCDQFNIVTLYETWQTKHGDFENFLPGFVNYDCIRTCSVKRGSGGVTVFVKESLSNMNYIHTSN